MSDKATRSIPWLLIAGAGVAAIGTILVVLGVSTALVSALFVGDIASMIDFATIVSFLTAPALGYLNLRAVSSDSVPAEHRPGGAMRALAWVGLVLLGGTGAVYAMSLVS